MDEIEVRSARCVQAQVPIGGQRRRPVDGCVPAIARMCDCKVWLSRAAAPAGAHYVFFGFETDTQLATYLFAMIDRAVATETDGFKRANPKLRATRLRRSQTSFQHGLVARVAARLEAMHDEREAAVRAQRATGTALILAKHRVVEDAFRETDVRLTSRSAPAPRVIGSAFGEGWAAGERVNLNRPVPGHAPGLLA